MDKYNWYFLEFVKIALFGYPAGYALWKWKQRSPASTFFYCASLVNLFAFLLWLLLMIAAGCIRSMASGSQVSQWLAYSGTAIMVVFVPLLSCLGSIVLSVVSTASPIAKYPVLFNFLMALLWIASAVAPN
jgi:hypothetical protein